MNLVKFVRLQMFCLTISRPIMSMHTLLISTFYLFRVSMFYIDCQSNQNHFLYLLLYNEETFIGTVLSILINSKHMEKITLHGECFKCHKSLLVVVSLK